MNKTHGLLVIALLCFSGTACEAADRRMIALVEQARHFAAAFEKGDYEKLIQATPPKILAKMGGRDVFLRTVKESSAGTVVTRCRVTEPTSIVTTTQESFAVVPSVTDVVSAGEEVSIHSFLLASSTDDGRTWVFLTGTKTVLDSLRTYDPTAFAELKFPQRRMMTKDATFVDRDGRWVPDDETLKKLRKMASE
jgi:hypothetical protein